MAILKINGVDIADPQKLTWDLYDLDSEEGAGRNQQGMMLRDRVGVKRKVNCSWGPMKNEEISKLLKAMDDAFFTLEYPDAHDGGFRTGTFYVGDRSTPMYYNGLWTGLSANFIER